MHYIPRSSATLETPPYDFAQRDQVFDGASNQWRKFYVDRLSVSWVDLGTRLVLRHVLRAIGAGYEHGRGSDQSYDDDEKDGDVCSEDVKGKPNGLKHTKYDASWGGCAESKQLHSGGVCMGEAMVEVDLGEVRWAEHTGGERRLSSSTAKKLAGGWFGKKRSKEAFTS